EIRMLVPQRAKAASSTKRNFPSSTTSSGSSTGWTEKQSRGWDMVRLCTDQSLEQHRAALRESPYTRFPLCGRDKGDIRGIIHIREADDFAAGETPDLNRSARPASWSRKQWRSRASHASCRKTGPEWPS